MLQLNGATLKQIKKFMYLGGAFTNDGRHDEELNCQIGKARAVMRCLRYSVVMIQDLSKNAKPLSLKTLFVSILIYGHESWVITAKVRSQMQESKMRFLQRIKEVALLNKVFQKSLNIEPLLLRIERCQLRLVGHVSKIPQKRLPSKVYLPKQMKGPGVKRSNYQNQVFEKIKKQSLEPHHQILEL